MQDCRAQCRAVVAVFVRRVCETVEIGDRTSDAMQLPVDEHANGSRPDAHDFVQRQAINGLAKIGHGRVLHEPHRLAVQLAASLLLLKDPNSSRRSAGSIFCATFDGEAGEMDREAPPPGSSRSGTSEQWRGGNARRQVKLMR